jgi:hypothetical protein
MMLTAVGTKDDDFQLHTCCGDPRNLLGVFVTREHVRHSKSGIAHRGRTGINH